MYTYMFLPVRSNAARHRQTVTAPPVSSSVEKPNRTLEYRERERDVCVYTCIHIYIYIYMYITTERENTSSDKETRARQQRSKHQIKSDQGLERNFRFWIAPFRERIGFHRHRCHPSRHTGPCYPH